MKVRVAVRGEGSNDYGVWDDYERALKQDGCYLAFVKAVVSRQDTEVEICCEYAGRFAKKFAGKKKPVLVGFEEHSYYSTLEAYNQGADWLIIGVDTDRGTGGDKNRLPEACRQRYGQLQAGYKKAVAFLPEAARVKLVVIVPLVKLESWLLADELAFELAAGFARGALPKRPEELYGTTDAKDFLNGLFENNERGRPGTSEKAELASSADPQALLRECPISYPPFLACLTD